MKKIKNQSIKTIKEELVAIAVVVIPDYTGLENEVVINTDGNWNGDRWGQCVGRTMKDGTVKSSFKIDIENENNEIFEKLRSDVNLIEKTRSIIINSNLEIVTDYFIPFKIKNHSSAIPTVNSVYVDRCSNVKYDVTYEIMLVAGEDFTRYLTFNYKTEGSYSSVFFDQVENLEITFEELFDKGERDFKEKDGDKTVAFYDNVGEKLDIDISSVSELLNMVTSIRVIKLDTEIIDK